MSVEDRPVFTHQLRDEARVSIINDRSIRMKLLERFDSKLKLQRSKGSLHSSIESNEGTTDRDKSRSKSRSQSQMIAKSSEPCAPKTNLRTVIHSN